MNMNNEKFNYSLITGDKNLKYLLGYKDDAAGIKINCKAKEDKGKCKFCNSPCGYNLMVEGYSGTGKTILACQLCCKTIFDSKDESYNTKFTGSFALFYSLDQSSSEIELIIDNFKFLPTKLIKILEEKQSLQKSLEVNPDIKLFIRELRNIHNLSHLLGKLQEDFSNDDGNMAKYPLIIVIDSINAILRKTEGYRGELKEILDFPWWKDNCYSEFKPITKILTFEKGLDTDRTEEYLCDCVIELRKEKQNRIFDIQKIRDQASYLGGNVFDIMSENDKGDNGMVIYPSLESCNRIYDTEAEKIDFQKVKDKLKLNNSRASFGITELDEALDALEKTHKQFKGINYGSSILIQGDPGSLKTELAVKFLYEGDLKEELGIFISFRMERDALKTINFFKTKPDNDKFIDEDLIFIRGFDTPFQTASQFMYKIKDIIDSRETDEKKVRRAVFFGIDVLNCYPSFRGKLLEFFQVLLEYFTKKHISCVFIDWSKSEMENVLTKLARNLIPNQIEIQNFEGMKVVKLLRKTHRFSTKFIPGKLIFNEKTQKLYISNIFSNDDLKNLANKRTSHTLTSKDTNELLGENDNLKGELNNLINESINSVGSNDKLISEILVKLKTALDKTK